MLYTLLTRSPLDITILHDRNPLYVKLSNGSIRNGYTLSIINKAQEDRTFRLEIKGLKDATLRVEQNDVVSPDNLRVFADSVAHFRVFIAAEQQHEHREEIEFIVTDTTSKIYDEKGTIFVSEGQ